MKYVVGLLICLGSVALHLPAFSTDHVIRAGGGGSSPCGTNWATACSNLPATLIRGDTYYVAAGSYSSYTFANTAGTSLITIKKATIADHGATSTNWLDSYATGQAVWPDWDWFMSNLLIDGITGGGPTGWRTGLGFAVRKLGADGTHHIFSDQNVTNVTLRHTELDGVDGSDGLDRDLFYLIGGSSNITFSYDWMHTISCDVAQLRGGTTAMTIEYTLVEGSRSNGCHADVLEYDSGSFSGLIVRYSYFNDDFTTYFFGSHESGQLTNYAIYGNIFRGGGADNGLISGLNAGSPTAINNGVFYNNTVVDVNGPNNHPMYGSDGIGSGNVNQNNLFYSTTSQNVSQPAAVSHNYNWYRNSGTQSETNIQNGTGNPFVNLAGENYALTAATNAGNTLGAPYNVDMFGNTRGADGTWDRGAIEFGSGGGDITPPSAPTNLRVVSFTFNQINLAWDASIDDIGVTGYLVEHIDSALCTPIDFIQVGAPAGLNFSDTGILINTTYCFRVRATDASNNLSAYSSTLTQTTDTVKFHPTLNLRRVAYGYLNQEGFYEDPTRYPFLARMF